MVVNDITQLDQISEQLDQIEGVADVHAPLELSDAFTAIQKVVNYVSYGLVAVLAIVSIVVINNTIRITVYARRKEIAIMKLVGATNGFIRFPFFVEGTTSGLISATIASGVVCGAYYAACQWYVNNPTTFSQMFGGQLVPSAGCVWYYIVIGFFALGFVLCGIGYRHQHPQAPQRLIRHKVPAAREGGFGFAFHPCIIEKIHFPSAQPGDGSGAVYLRFAAGKGR